MKRKLTSLLIAAIAAFSYNVDAFAQLSDGDYILQNVESGTYLGGANNWGTRASLVPHGQRFTITLSGGAYSLDSHTYNNAASHFLTSELFIDGAKTNWTINPVAGKTDVYTLTTDGINFVSSMSGVSTVEMTKDPESSAAQWKIMRIDDLVANLKPGDDVTYLLKGAAVSRNLYNDQEKAWKDGNGTLVSLPVGGPNENFNAERWGGNVNTFHYYQELTIPNGEYNISVFGFYRYNNTGENTNAVAVTAHANGTEELNAILYANDSELPLMSIADETAATALGGTAKIPFSQADASAAFEKGLYKNTVRVKVTDGKLTIGIRKDTHPGTDWTVWDNFEIEYLGDGTDLTVYINALNKAVEDAEAVTGKMNADVASALADAISTYKGASYSNVDDYTAAVDVLTKAISSAKASVSVYSEIASYNDKAAALTATGQAAYAAAGVAAAYEAGTYTSSESAKAAYIAAAKAQTEEGAVIDVEALGNITDSFDGWSINNGSTFHLNTWSVEGNTDGTGMTTPFIENWVANGGKLPEGVISYTLRGLIPNQFYTVNALIRVYNENSSVSPEGACLYAGSGKSKDISEGTTFVYNGTTAGVYDTYSAIGKADENGDLVIGVIQENNNYNWLAIKSVSVVISAAPGLSSMKLEYADLVAKANALAEKPMNATVYDALTSAIITPEETVEAYEAAITSVNAAISDAKVSVAKYETALEYVNRTASMDESAKAAYNANATVAAVSAAVADKSLEELSDEQIADMNAAYIVAVKSQSTAGSDMTAAIVNPSFETGNYNGWTTTNSDDTGAKSTTNATYVMSGSDGNYLFNTWKTGYSIEQVIEGLNPGKYTVSAVMATDPDQTLVLYANNGVCKKASVDKGTGINMSVTVNVTGGSLRITAGTSNTFWYKVDDFHLTFTEPISYEDYYEQITQLVDSATAITSRQSVKTAADLKTAVEAAQKASGKEKDIVKLQSVISDIENAITASLASIEEYNRGAAFNAIIDENGAGAVLVEEEAVINHWTRSFLSDGALGDWHINSWSTEGESDGSEMKTPFLENWIAPGQILSDAVFNHVGVAGLREGYYKVSVLARIYNQTGDTPTGAAIFKVNDDFVNMISTGTSIENKGMAGYYGTYEIVVYINEDKDLNSSVTISGVDFNWISLKNYKVEYLGVEPKTVNIDITETRIKQGDTVQLSASILPENAVQNVVWSSSNTDVAIVSPDGTVTAISDGTAVITATSAVNSKIKATSTITVAYPAELANGTFDVDDDFVTENVAASDAVNSLPVTEWTSNGGAAWSASAVVAYGSDAQMNGVAAPATDKDGNAGGALGISVGWEGVVTYTQKLQLLAGTYVLTADVYNANLTANAATSKFGFIVNGDEAYVSSKTEYPYGVWTKEKIAFTLDKTTVGDVQIGIAAGNKGSGSHAKVFIDNVSVRAIDPVDLAKDDVLDILNGLSPVGNAIFQYSSAAIEKAKEEVMAASTIEAVQAVAIPGITLPEEGAAYQIKFGSAESYMSVTPSGIKLSKYAQPLYLEQSENGFLIANSSSEYVAYLGTNKWSLSAGETGSELTISNDANGYSIKGTNGFLGVDNSANGSSVYGNKAVTYWSIEPFVPRNFIISDELTIADYETIAADLISIDATVNSTATTAIVNHGTVTANKVSFNLTIPNDKWSFVVFPYNVPVADFLSTQENTQWKIYKYDGKARANAELDKTWVAMTNADVLVAGEGYIIQSRCENEATSTFTFATEDKDAIAKIFENGDVKVALSKNSSTYASNAGWNLVGNPYVSYYNKNMMSVTSPITVWENETYASYSSDDDYVLTPFQAFFVQVADDTELVFDESGRMTSYYSLLDFEARSRAGVASRNIYNFLISDGTYSDKTRFVLSDEASLGYEIGRDASKFMSTNAEVPQIYTVDGSVSYSINERPMADGTIALGAYFGHDGEYSISVAGIASVVVLEDKLTGETVTLGAGTDCYTFTAKAGIADSRFVLHVGDDATAIAGVNKDNVEASEVFTLQGVKVPASAVKHGVYIVNGKKVMIK